MSHSRNECKICNISFIVDKGVSRMKKGKCDNLVTKAQQSKYSPPTQPDYSVSVSLTEHSNWF